MIRLGWIEVGSFTWTARYAAQTVVATLHRNCHAFYAPWCCDKSHAVHGAGRFRFSRQTDDYQFGTAVPTRRTYSLTSSHQSCASAKSKIACEPPLGRPQAASTTLAFRNSLTPRRGTSAYPPHPSKPEAAPPRKVAALAKQPLPPAVAPPQKEEAPPSRSVAMQSQQFRFQQVCSCGDIATMTSGRQAIACMGVVVGEPCERRRPWTACPDRSGPPSLKRLVAPSLPCEHGSRVATALCVTAERSETASRRLPEGWRSQQLPQATAAPSRTHSTASPEFPGVP